MATSNSEKRTAWIDVESTGKDPSDGSRLIQVACIITDGDLNEVSEGFEMKLYYSKDEVAEMYAVTDPYVQNMHTVNGLWNALPTEGVPAAEVEAKLLAELKRYIPEAGMAELGGNSITLDRNFLRAELPSVLDYLSYRSYDMSSVSKHYDDNTDIPRFQKKLAHDALEDIRESIAEARYYSNIMRDLFSR